MNDASGFAALCPPVPTPATAARGWPLVHRTNRPGAEKLDEIIANRKLTAIEAGSRAEVAAGRSPASYAFLASGAYPLGTVAFLLDPSLTAATPATLTPFDTGGLGKGCFTHEQPAADVYTRWCTNAETLETVGPVWVAHLFDEPEEYVRRLVGDPDRAPAHGISSPSGFKGAWAIEVQVQGDISLERWLKGIVLADRSLFLKLRRLGAPAEWLGVARRPRDDAATEETFAATIAAAILEP